LAPIPIRFAFFLPPQGACRDQSGVVASVRCYLPPRLHFLARPILIRRLCATPSRDLLCHQNTFTPFKCFGFFVPAFLPYRKKHHFPFPHFSILAVFPRRSTSPLAFLIPPKNFRMCLFIPWLFSLPPSSVCSYYPTNGWRLGRHLYFPVSPTDCEFPFLWTQISESTKLFPRLGTT